MHFSLCYTEDAVLNFILANGNDFSGNACGRRFQSMNSYKWLAKQCRLQKQTIQSSNGLITIIHHDEHFIWVILCLKKRTRIFSGIHCLRFGCCFGLLQFFLKGTHDETEIFLWVNLSYRLFIPMAMPPIRDDHENWLKAIFDR